MKRIIVIFMTLCLIIGMSSISVLADSKAWQQEEKMPQRLNLMSSCVIGNNIYVMGGIINTEKSRDRVHVYDLEKKFGHMGRQCQKQSDGLRLLL